MIIMTLLVGAMMVLVITIMEISDRPLHKLAIAYGGIMFGISLIIFGVLFGASIGVIFIKSILASGIAYMMLRSFKKYYGGYRLIIYLVGGMMIMILQVYGF